MHLYSRCDKQATFSGGNIFWTKIIRIRVKPVLVKISKMTCVPSKDSDQTGQLIDVSNVYEETMGPKLLTAL